jgi:hypothetical protein
MQTAKELFVHELADMLDAGQKLVEALRQLAEDHSGKPQLQKGFQQQSGASRRIPDTPNLESLKCRLSPPSDRFQRLMLRAISHSARPRSTLAVDRDSSAPDKPCRPS